MVQKFIKQSFPIASISCKIIVLILLFGSTIYGQTADNFVYKLKDGRILKDNCTYVEEINTKGNVKKLINNQKDFYYIAINSDNQPIVGILKSVSDEHIHKELDLNLSNSIISNFDAKDNMVFFLAKKNNSTLGTLYRIDMNSMNVAPREGVFDFKLVNGIAAFIEEYNGNRFVNYNGIQIPILIKGTVAINNSVNNRIIFVSNETDTEIVDLLNKKSLYQYSQTKEYKEPDEFNLIISAIDKGKQKKSTDEEMVFYKIYIDGVYSGRTETALTSVYKAYSTKVELNKYHVLRLERWELSKQKKRYIRVNNVYQPNSIRFFVPQKRILAIDVTFSGRKYLLQKYAVYK